MLSSQLVAMRRRLEVDEAQEVMIPIVTDHRTRALAPEHGGAPGAVSALVPIRPMPSTAFSPRHFASSRATNRSKPRSPRSADTHELRDG